MSLGKVILKFTFVVNLRFRTHIYLTELETNIRQDKVPFGVGKNGELRWSSSGKSDNAK